MAHFRLTLPRCIPLLMLVICGCRRNPPDIREQLNDQGNVAGFQAFGSDVLDRDIQRLEGLATISSLSLQECKQVTDQGFEHLSEAAALESLKVIRLGITDEALSALTGLENLKEVELAHTKVAGSGIGYLPNQIRRLVIRSREVRAEQLQAIAELSELRELELYCQDISLSELPGLKQLQNLEVLVATQTPVGEGGLESLRDLEQLRVLKVASEDVGDDAVPVLNTLSSLEEADLVFSTITNTGLQALDLPNIKHLNLSSCAGITDAGLIGLAGLPNLQVLILSESGVTGEDLSGLKAAPKLKEVYLMGEQFKGTPEVIEALKAELPDCEVIIMQG